MTDSHNVSFRAEDDQPCPNCGEVVEKFKQTTYGGYYEGYECENCDVRWDWEEWADGVEKRPDPDPQHEVTPLNERLIGHAYRDILRAIEQGSFAVETPRVHASKSTFEHIDWAIERDTQQYHGQEGLCGVSVGPPYLSIELEWQPEDTALLDDLGDHGNYEAPCILHGQMHLWQMEEQYGHKVQCMADSAWTPSDVEQTGPAATAMFEWHAVEEVGWQ